MDAAHYIITKLKFHHIIDTLRMVKLGTMGTVSFDVGGTKYRVSRSLIEIYPKTMLARLVSDTWQKDPDKEIFIDRDGDRFRYILDYMRHQKVSLPVTDLTKHALLQELEYFGFENVDSEAIDTCYSSNYEAIKHVANLTQQSMEEINGYKKSIEGLNRCIEGLNSAMFHCALASELVQDYCATGQLAHEYRLDATLRTIQASRSIREGTDPTLLAEHLAGLGFKCAIRKTWRSTVFTLSKC